MNTWIPSHIQITVLQARDLLLKSKSIHSEVFVTLQVDKERQVTHLLPRHTCPIWNQTFEIPLMSLDSSVQVTVKQKNKFSEEFIGHLTIPFTNLSISRRNKQNWYKLGSKPGKTSTKIRGDLLLSTCFISKWGKTDPTPTSPPIDIEGKDGRMLRRTKSEYKGSANGSVSSGKDSPKGDKKSKGIFSRSIRKKNTQVFEDSDDFMFSYRSAGSPPTPPQSDRKQMSFTTSLNEGDSSSSDVPTSMEGGLLSSPTSSITNSTSHLLFTEATQLERNGIIDLSKADPLLRREQVKQQFRERMNNTESSPQLNKRLRPASMYTSPSSSSPFNGTHKASIDSSFEETTEPSTTNRHSTYRARSTPRRQRTTSVNSPSQQGDSTDKLLTSQASSTSIDSNTSEYYSGTSSAANTPLNSNSTLNDSVTTPTNNSPVIPRKLEATPPNITSSMSPRKGLNMERSDSSSPRRTNKRDVKLRRGQTIDSSSTLPRLRPPPRPQQDRMSTLQKRHKYSGGSLTTSNDTGNKRHSADLAQLIKKNSSSGGKDGLENVIMSGKVERFLRKQNADKGSHGDGSATPPSERNFFTPPPPPPPVTNDKILESNKTTPTENKTTPIENKTTPTENKTTPTEDVATPINDVPIATQQQSDEVETVSILSPTSPTILSPASPPLVQDDTLLNNMTTTQPGGVDIAQPGGVATAQPGGVATTQSGGVATTQSGGVATTQSGGVATTQSGSVATAQSGGVATTQPGGVAATQPGGVATTQSGGVATTNETLPIINNISISIESPLSSGSTTPSRMSPPLSSTDVTREVTPSPEHDDEIDGEVIMTPKKNKHTVELKSDSFHPFKPLPPSISSTSGIQRKYSSTTDITSLMAVCRDMISPAVQNSSAHLEGNIRSSSQCSYPYSATSSGRTSPMITEVDREEEEGEDVKENMTPTSAPPSTKHRFSPLVTSPLSPTAPSSTKPSGKPSNSKENTGAAAGRRKQGGGLKRTLSLYQENKRQVQISKDKRAIVKRQSNPLSNKGSSKLSSSDSPSLSQRSTTSSKGVSPPEEDRVDVGPTLGASFTTASQRSQQSNKKLLKQDKKDSPNLSSHEIQHSIQSQTNSTASSVPSTPPSITSTDHLTNTTPLPSPLFITSDVSHQERGDLAVNFTIDQDSSVSYSSDAETTSSELEETNEDKLRQLSKEDLISELLRSRTKLKAKSRELNDTRLYLDSLLVKVMNQNPELLFSDN